MNGNTKEKSKNSSNGGDGLLELKNKDKYVTIGELFEKSRPSPVYYTLLFLSSVIIACGLLLNNSTIVIGGMLVTPLLTPILVIALGISVGEAGAIKQSAILVLKSVLVVVVVAFLLAIIFGVKETAVLGAFDDSLRLAILYFVVAFISGVAATFAMVRKEVAEILPGIAIAVSLVPPMTMLGIYLSAFNLSALRLSFFIFIFNLVGVILGSMVVFSLLKFQKAENIVKKEVKEQEQEQEQKQETK